MATTATMVGPASPPPAPPPATADKEGATESRDLVLKVLGAVGAGIGIIGFVTLFGGAILWVRANEAGLPANEAVAVVPRAVLVTTGASFLVPAVLLALLVVLMISSVHMMLSLPARIGARTLTREASERRYLADEAQRELEPAEQLAVSARELATNLSNVAEEVGKTQAGSSRLGDLLEPARAQMDIAKEHEQTALALRATAESLNAEAQKLEAEREGRLVNTPQRQKLQRWVEWLIVFGMLALVPLLFYGSLKGLSTFHQAILVAVAVTAAGLSLAVYLSTEEKLLWLGVVAFMAVGVYAGCDTYLRTIQDPKVEPAAALLGTRPPVTGLFVAETSSDLYLGTFAGSDSLAPRLLVIPLSQVTDLSVGPLLDPGDARVQAIELAQDECHKLLEQADAKTAGTPLCSKREDQSLQASLGRS
ncbi:MAG: hypothetical protein ACRDK4_03835 [Solirubrobacteraceae bacterium]